MYKLLRKSIAPLRLKYTLKPYNASLLWSGEFIENPNPDGTVTLTCYDSSMAFPIGSITFNKESQSIINVDVLDYHRTEGLATVIAQYMIKICNGHCDYNYMLCTEYEDAKVNGIVTGFLTRSG